MRRQFPTLVRKVAGDFLPKVGLYLCHQGVVPPVLMMHFRFNTETFRSYVSFEKDDLMFVCFVFGISLTSGQLVSELFPDCTRSCFSQVVLRRRGGDRIYEMRCLFLAVGPNARFIVLPHWDNMS